MKRWIGAAVIFMAVVGWHGQASAACTTHTINDLNSGRIIFCQTCCSGGLCNTTCF